MLYDCLEGVLGVTSLNSASIRVIPIFQADYFFTMYEKRTGLYMYVQ